MAITLRTVTGSARQLLGDTFGTGPTSPTKIRAVRVVSNLDPSQGIIDLANNQIRLGTETVTVDASGNFTITGLLDYNSTDVNPTGIQYQISIEYVDSTSRGYGGAGVKTWSSGWLEVTADADLSDLVSTLFVPPSYISQAITEIQGYVASARDISQIDTSDDVVSALVAGTGGAGPETRAALTASFGQVSEIPPTPQRYRQPGDADWTAAFGRLFADARRSAYVPEAAAPYDISATLTMPDDFMGLDLAPGATVRATSAINGPMLKIGTGSVQREFGRVHGGVWDCNNLAKDGLFAPWQWGLLISDLVVKDHARHGIVLGDADHTASAQHKIRGVEMYSSPGRLAPVGSYGVWLAKASDGDISDTTVQSAETGFRADSPTNRYISCHVWFSGSGHNKIAFDDQTGHNEWINCNPDTPSQYGWVLAGYHSRIIGGISVLGDPTLDNVPIAQHVPAGAYEGAIIGHRTLGATGARWAYDHDGLVPWQNLKVIGCSTSFATTARLDRDSVENLRVFRELQLNTENAGPKLTGGGANPNGLIAGVAGQIWFRTDTPGTANQRIYVCTGGTSWTPLV